VRSFLPEIIDPWVTIQNESPADFGRRSIFLSIFLRFPGGGQLCALSAPSPGTRCLPRPPAVSCSFPPESHSASYPNLSIFPYARNLTFLISSIRETAARPALSPVLPGSLLLQPTSCGVLSRFWRPFSANGTPFRLNPFPLTDCSASRHLRRSFSLVRL